MICEEIVLKLSGTCWGISEADLFIHDWWSSRNQTLLSIRCCQFPPRLFKQHQVWLLFCFFGTLFKHPPAGLSGTTGDGNWRDSELKQLPSGFKVWSKLRTELHCVDGKQNRKEMLVVIRRTRRHCWAQTRKQRDSDMSLRQPSSTLDRYRHLHPHL